MILDVPLLHVRDMQSSERKDIWTEQDAQDAARLLERLEQRSKRRAGQTPAEIQNSPIAGPCVSGENGGQILSAQTGPQRFKGSGRQLTQPGEDGCDPVAGSTLEGNGNGYGAVGVECVNEAPMRPTADQRRFEPERLTTGLEGNRAVRWGNGE